MHFSGETSPCADITASFWRLAVRNSCLLIEFFLCFLTYCGKFFHLSHYLYFRQSVINHLANSDITFKHPIKANNSNKIHGSIYTWVIICLGGNLTGCLPQVLAGYLFVTSNFSHLYRNTTMSEFEFFKERADRWGDSMRALWGSLEICPPHRPYRSSLPHGRRTTFHWPLKGLGRHPKAASRHGLLPGVGWWHLGSCGIMAWP